ncbi:hypothetical protein K493DRAFT_411266 [Basidiobolus meristosporus CBS 931.73]|uniref:CBD9-like protein n=1 Tax=Basidiobolus meristosporus CBS 931.73 TaxID=1314790 RepID=A0A1Y1XMD2_9FUNG|nr:hypothetical protein K493DRAFT_411266 [Basidiobolus meristosporus CBS 931.73]|eukprot:ORX86863.1 hypothetical protein K493DRAFT_411266 [Basidiobolus meristosporus CBS 931.73]
MQTTAKHELEDFHEQEDSIDSDESTLYYSDSELYVNSLHELETFLAPASLSECTSEEKVAYAKIAGLLDKKVDGNLNEPAWEAVKWSAYFGDIQDGASQSSNVQSRFKMLQDSQYIYIGCELKNPLASKDLDELFGLSKLGIFYNPRSTNHNYKQIMTNPYGQTEQLLWDKPPANNGRNSTSWTLGSQSKKAIKIQGSGGYRIASRANKLERSWTVEWALPINKLDVTQKRGDENEFDSNDLDPNRSSINILVVIPSRNFGGRFKRSQNDIKYITQTWTPQNSQDIQNPEYWGTFGFSAGNATTTPKDVSALPRYILGQVYRAQANYFKTHQRYTDNLGDLSIEGPALGTCSPTPIVKLGDDGKTYVAELLVDNYLGQINQDRYTQFLRCQN